MNMKAGFSGPQPPASHGPLQSAQCCFASELPDTCLDLTGEPTGPVMKNDSPGETGIKKNKTVFSEGLLHEGISVFQQALKAQ